MHIYFTSGPQPLLQLLYWKLKRAHLRVAGEVGLSFDGAVAGADGLVQFDPHMLSRSKVHFSGESDSLRAHAR